MGRPPSNKYGMPTVKKNKQQGKGGLKNKNEYLYQRLA